MVRKQKRLGEMLVEAGLITEAQLQGALGRQRKWGGRLGTNLVKLGNIKEEELGRFLARQTGVQEMNISGVKILPHILKLVPKKIAEKYHLIPVAMKDKNTLIVACADPTDLGALDHISFITGHKVEAVISTFASILDAISRHYPGGTTLSGNESIALADDTMPTLMELDDMTGHGGQAASGDPELIIFGNQSETLTPENQAPLRRPAPFRAAPERLTPPTPVPAPTPAPTRAATTNDSAEFTLDFNPDWARPPKPAATAAAFKVQTPAGPSAPTPFQATPSIFPLPAAQPASPPSNLTDQKLKVLLRLLIKKGLITEEELRHEWSSLQSKGKL